MKQKEFAQQFTPIEPPIEPMVESATQRRRSARDGSDAESCCRAPAVEPFEPFPIDALPEPVRGFVNVGAKSIDCDVSYIATPLLSALGSCIGNSRCIRLKRGWTEPAVVWAAIVGESGTLKTPAFRLVTRPLHELQGRTLAQHASEIEAYEIALRNYDRELQRWKRSKSGDNPPEKPDEPNPVRLIVSDTTVEALAPILQTNWRGVLLARDELAGWIGGFDRYARGSRSDAPHWLSMWSGESLVVDRKTGPQRTIYVPRAAVSICGGIQPAILQHALGVEHRENGLAARLLLAMPPRRPRRWREADIPPEHEARLALLYDRLRELRPNETPDGPEPVVVGMTPGAKRLWIAFFNEHGQEQAELTGDLAAAFSKLEAYAARFAIIIHFVRWAADDPKLSDPELVDEGSMSAGVALARWFGHEARRVYSMLGESDEDRDRRRLVELIELRGGSTSVRDWQRSRSHETSADAEAELKTLESAGYGTLGPAPQTGRGRPSKVFTLHPDTTDTDNNPTEGSDFGIVSVSEVSEGGGRQESHP